MVPANGSHMCVLSCFSHVWLSETPWTVTLQAPLSMGFSRQEYWSELPCPPPGDLPDPGIEPTSLASPALAGRFFTTSTTWELPNGSQCRTKNNTHEQPAAPSFPCWPKESTLVPILGKQSRISNSLIFPGILAPFSTKLYPCWIYYWSHKFWVLERAKFLNNSLKFLKSHEIDNHCEWQPFAQKENGYAFSKEGKRVPYSCILYHTGSRRNIERSLSSRASWF